MTDGKEGQTPSWSRSRGPRQPCREAPPRVWSSTEPRLQSPALPSLLGHPVLARVSMNPAAASVQPQGMSVGDSTSSPVSQQQAQMSPSAAADGERGRAGLASVRRQRGGRAQHEGTWAFCTAECGSLFPGCLARSRVGTVPQGTGHIQPCPSPGSQPTQPPLLVQLLEEGLAKFVGADHDGAGGCHLNDAGQEACKDKPVSPSVTPGHQ